MDGRELVVTVFWMRNVEKGSDAASAQYSQVFLGKRCDCWSGRISVVEVVFAFVFWDAISVGTILGGRKWR